MFDREHASHLPDLLICLLGCYQVVAGEDHRSNVPQPFPSDLHGGPEARIERSSDPCGAEIATIVEVGERFGRLEREDFGKVPTYVEVEKGDDNGLPRSEMRLEEERKAAEEGRAIFVTTGSPSQSQQGVNGRGIDRWHTEAGRRTRRTQPQTPESFEI